MKAAIVFIAFFFFVVFVSKAEAAITFTISNPIVNSDDSIDVDASISGLISSSCSTTGCYLQAELRILDESKGFFGYTYNNSGEFIDYFSSSSSTDEIKTKLFNFVPVSGAWSGKLKAKNNFNDSNYLGPGQYSLRIRRFSGNSTSPTTSDSNTLTIDLTLAVPTSTPTPTPTETPTPDPTNTPTPTKIPTPTLTPTPTKTPTPAPISNTPTLKPSLSPTPEILPTSVLGESTESGSTIFPTDTINKENVLIFSNTKNPKNNFQKILMLVGIVFIVTCAILTFRVIMKNKSIKNE